MPKDELTDEFYVDKREVAIIAFGIILFVILLYILAAYITGGAIS